MTNVLNVGTQIIIMRSMAVKSVVLLPTEEDCGSDGIENIPMTYPFCCKKHMDEARIYCRQQFVKETKRILH